MNDAAIQLAETIQTASINRAPSPTHDLNPSTTVSYKQPVQFRSPSASVASDEAVEVAGDGVEEDEIPLSVLRPTPRRNQLPPLPDLRFEQSYLRSIEKAESSWAVAYITIKDHVSYGPLLSLDGGIGTRLPHSVGRALALGYEGGGGVSTTGSCQRIGKN
ncbi:hypothetical protein LTR66_010415 [Elasticomyces elasticus]|nr:hypothetical protein LTR66_010415 [Elasticomyces elasticus]